MTRVGGANPYLPGAQMMPLDQPTMERLIYGVDIMQRGHTGDAIKQLQVLLNAAGAQPPLALDGIFGPKTEAAVQALQQKSGITPDGKVGIDTLLGIQAVVSGDPQLMAMIAGSGMTLRAPHVNAPPVQGGLRAGDLAQADIARRFGNGGNGANAPAPVNTPPTTPITGGNGAASINVPWFSQFDANNVPGAGDTACYRAVRAMAARAGVNVPPGTGDRIQVATGEDHLGRVRTDPARVAEARNYIDRQLDAGRPVAVGVSHKNANYNQDGITDHFVLITGRGTDDQGRTYYTYHDPATTNRANGTNNRFYVDPQSGNLVHQGNLASGYVRDRHTEVSMVVRSN